MNAIASAMNVYKSVEHVIRRESDITTAIKHLAERVTFKNKHLLKELHRVEGVKYLSVSGLHITELPALPPNLISLKCSDNGLDKLPKLPSTLVTLECYFNQLRQLPALRSNLVTLKCSNNWLEQLPALPSTLVTLGCSRNKLVQQTMKIVTTMMTTSK